MATDGLGDELPAVKAKILQVEAALEGHAATADVARDEAFGRAGIYAHDWLPLQLRSHLMELQKKQNLLLEREMRASRASDERYGFCVCCQRVVRKPGLVCAGSSSSLSSTSMVPLTTLGPFGVELALGLSWSHAALSPSSSSPAPRLKPFFFACVSRASTTCWVSRRGLHSLNDRLTDEPLGGLGERPSSSRDTPSISRIVSSDRRLSSLLLSLVG